MKILCKQKLNIFCSLTFLWFLLEQKQNLGQPVTLIFSFKYFSLVILNDLLSKTRLEHVWMEKIAKLVNDMNTMVGMRKEIGPGGFCYRQCQLYRIINNANTPIFFVESKRFIEKTVNFLPCHVWNQRPNGFWKNFIKWKFHSWRFSKSAWTYRVFVTRVRSMLELNFWKLMNGNYIYDAMYRTSIYKLF